MIDVNTKTSMLSGKWNYVQNIYMYMDYFNLKLRFFIISKLNSLMIMVILALGLDQLDNVDIGIQKAVDTVGET